MTVFFAEIGVHGGLLHSAPALLPFWAVLGVLGIDHLTGKLFGERRNRRQSGLGSNLALGVCVGLGVVGLISPPTGETTPVEYADFIPTYVPSDARVMIYNVTDLYYSTQMTSVIMPNAPVDTAQEIAGNYCLTHLILTSDSWDSFQPLFRRDIPPPPFLKLVVALEYDVNDAEDDVVIYQFIPEQIDYQEQCTH
jgi:hypothetical protein